MSEGYQGRHRVAAIVILAAASGALVYAATRERVEPDAMAQAPEAAGWSETAAVTGEPTPPPPPVEAPVSATESAGTAPETPAFGLLRVEPDGATVVAGTAEPGAEVTIYADAAPLATAETDAEGNFVAIFEVEPSSEPRALTLGATTPGAAPATSDEVVMLLPSAPPAPDGEATPAGEPAVDDGAAATEPAPADAVEVAAADPEPAVAATAILRADGVEVASVGAGAPDGDVSLASISYAEAGDVTLAGRGTAGAVVRAYANDELAEEAQIGADGRWSMDLGDVEAGLYQLRIDELAADGRVASRVETPFQRDYPRAPLPRPGRPGDPGALTVTVQPGHNLWTLAREHYGSGVLYTQIFTANSDLIRDPDLIYPGQIFAMPAASAAD
jgi:nucleoid-associated protein YgaU